MPTYEYKCMKCGHTIELYQFFNEDPLKECPKCHNVLKKLIGSGSCVIFKGSGFHCNDYRKDTHVAEE